MNFAWIVQGISQVRNSTPVKNSMDAIYSLVKTDEDPNKPRRRKRKRGNDDDDEDKKRHRESH